MDEPDELTRFWEQARLRAGLGRTAVVTGTTAAMVVAPPAWAFGTTAQQSDDLLALLLAGRKTATTTTVAAFEEAGQELPRVGDLAIVLDGAGHPAALVRTTAVRVVRFDEVDARHAAADHVGTDGATDDDGADDVGTDGAADDDAADDAGVLARWRDVVGRQLADELEELGRPLADDVPVVLEELRLLHPSPRDVSQRVLVDA